MYNNNGTRSQPTCWCWRYLLFACFRLYKVGCHWLVTVCLVVILDQFDSSKISCRNVAVQRGLKKVATLLLFCRHFNFIVSQLSVTIVIHCSRPHSVQVVHKHMAVYFWWYLYHILTSFCNFYHSRHAVLCDVLCNAASTDGAVGRGWLGHLPQGIVWKEWLHIRVLWRGEKLSEPCWVYSSV